MYKINRKHNDVSSTNKDSLMFSPDYFTNPLTNPLTKNNPKYKKNNLAKQTTARETDSLSLINSNSSLNVNEKIILLNKTESILLESLDDISNNGLQVNIPHKNVYMSNQKNENLYSSYNDIIDKRESIKSASQNDKSDIKLFV